MAEKSVTISPGDILDVVDAGCNVCGSRERKIFVHQKPIGGRSFDYVRCRRCGLRYVHPMIVMKPEVLGRLYGDKLISDFQKSVIRGDLSDPDRKDRCADFQRQLLEIKKYAKIGKILDVGCGDGWFLKTAKEMGWEVVGIDVSGPLCEYARGRLDLHVIQKQLREAAFPSAYFDAIRLSDIVEHMQDPKGLLVESNRVLKPDGIAVIHFPNPEPLMMDFMRLVGLLKGSAMSWNGNLDPPYHLYDFPLHTMTRLLKDAGFRVIKNETVISGDVACSVDTTKSPRSKIKRAVINAIDNLARISRRGDSFTVFAQKGMSA